MNRIALRAAIFVTLVLPIAFGADACGTSDSSTADGAVDAAGDVFSTDVAQVDAADGGTADAGCTGSTNFTNDPLNCGACGHNCLGGACQNSLCQPYVMQSPLEPYVYAMATDHTGAYWTDEALGSNNGAVRYLSNTALAAVTLASGLSAPTTIASDGVSIYFQTLGQEDAGQNWYGGQVLTCPVAGCSPSPTVLMNIPGAQGLSYGVATSSNTAFWSIEDDKIYAHVEGSDASTIFTTGSSVNTGFTIATDSTYLYWGGSPVAKEMLTGSNVQNLDPTSFARRLVVGPNAIFAYRNGGDIGWCPLPDCAGGMQELIGADAGTYVALAGDATSLYFTSADTSGHVLLMSCLQSDCKPTQIGSVDATICDSAGVNQAIGVNDTAIFWACNTSGSASQVWRLAK